MSQSWAMDSMVGDSRVVVVSRRRRCWRRKKIEERLDGCSWSSDWWSGGLSIHLLGLQEMIGGGGSNNSLPR